MLCQLHRGGVYSPAQRRCMNCGGNTYAVQFRLCRRCSSLNKACQVCAKALNPGSSGPTTLPPPKGDGQ
jgi:hypothetical protein